VSAPLIFIYLPSGTATASDVQAYLQASHEAMAIVSIALSDGSIPWQYVDVVLTGGTDEIRSIDATEASASLVRRSLHFSLPAAGLYDIGLTRLTPDSTDQLIRDQAVWTVLRTMQEALQLYPSGMAMVAMRIKATDQLNGTVDQFNVLAQSILPDWTGSAWLPAVTANPASIYRDVLQGSANARPLADDRLDLVTFQGFHQRCAANGFTFNASIDYLTTVRALGTDVLAAGRATPGLRDGLYSIVEDLAQLVPAHILTPRNSWGFKGTKVFADLPHALKMQFVNPAKDFQQDQILVYADGYDASNATIFESMDAGVGVTSPDQAWKLGRYHLAVLSLRPETYELNCDFEHLVFQRGDLVMVQHDVPLFALISGRIKTVTLDSIGRTTAIGLDEPCVMEAGQRYGVRIRLQDGTQIQREVETVAGTQTTFTLLQPI